MSESKSDKIEAKTAHGKRRLSLQSLGPQARAYASAGICSVEVAGAPGFKPPADHFEVAGGSEADEVVAAGHQPVAIYKADGMHVVFKGKDPRQVERPKGKG